MLATVNSRGTISFKNGNSYTYEFPLFQLHVQKLNNDVARVWFSDANRTPIPVPPNTVQIDGDETVHNDFNGSFFLTWLGSHSISHNGVIIFQINNQRQVSVHSICEHWDVRDVAGRVVRRDGQRITQVREVLLARPLIVQPAQAPVEDDDMGDDEEQADMGDDENRNDI